MKKQVSNHQTVTSESWIYAMYSDFATAVELSDTLIRDHSTVTKKLNKQRESSKMHFPKQ